MNFPHPLTPRLASPLTRRRIPGARTLAAITAFALALSLVCAPQAARAASGNFNPYIITRQGAGIDVYTPASGSISFGSIANGTSWLLEGGEITSWADGGDTKTSASMMYRVYRDGQTAPSFTTLNLPSASTSGNDTKWAKTDLGLSLAGSTVQIDGATYNGNYSTEFYYQAVFNWGSQYNYVGTSTATTAPTTDFYKATYSLTGFDYYVDVASGSTSQGSATGGAAQLTGGVGVGKYGAGTVTFGNTANDYTGRTLVAEGTLQTTAAGVIPDGSHVLIKSGATLDLNNNNETVASVGQYASANGGGIKLGTGTLTVTANSTNVSQNGIDGAGGLTKQGSHTLNLYGTLSYTGTTRVEAGLLVASNAVSSTNYVLSGGTLSTVGSDRILDAAAITFSGGDLRIGGNDTIGDGGVTLLTSATNSSIRAQTSGSITINGKVTGSGNLVKYGAGNLLLNSINNDLSGTVILQEGLLRITNANNLGTAALQMGSGTTSSTFQVSNNVTRTAGLSISNGSTGSAIEVGTGATFTQSGNLTGGTDNGTKFGKSGAGTLVLSGTASTYGGQIQIGQGAVIVAQNNALSTNTTTGNRGIDLGLNVGDTPMANNVAVYGRDGVTISNSIYVAANTGDATRTIGLDGTGTTTFNNDIYLDGILTITAATGGNVAVSGNILTSASNNVGGINKTGAGTATLSGNNTYSNSTTVTEGALRAAANTALGNTAGSTTVSSGAALEFSNNITTAEALSLAGTGISSGGALRNISGNNTNSGAITLTASSRINSDAGTLALSGGITGTGYALTVGGAGDVNISTSGINMSTAGTLAKDGAGVLTVGAAGNYTGGTTLSSGTLRAGNNSALGTGSLALNGGTLASDSATARTLGNNITMDGDVILGEASTGTGDLKLSGTVALGASGRTFTVNNSLSELSGNIGGDAGVGLTKSGSGTLVLSGNNSHSGTTTVGAGVLVLSNGSAVANTAAVALSDVAGATLSVAGSETIGSLRGGGATGGNVSIAGGQTLTVAETGGQTFAGVISNTGALAKTGAGTLTLTAANTYTGATTVSAGKLVVDGSIASSAVTVTNTGTIGGSGSVGALTINGGGTLAPGNSPGTLYAASSTWGDGGKYDWEIFSLTNNPGTSWDLLSVTPGSLDLTGLSAGGYTINLITLSGPSTQGALADFNSATNYSNWLIASAPIISGFNANLFNLDSSLFVGATGAFAIEQRAITGGQGLFLTYTGGGQPIPEPSTWAAAALLAGCAALLRRRRRSA